MTRTLIATVTANTTVTTASVFPTTSTSSPSTTSTSTHEGIPQPLALPPGYSPGYGRWSRAGKFEHSNSRYDAPTVSITAPAASSTVSGSSVTLTATATDNVAVANVRFEVDGTNIGSAITSSPYTTTWNSVGVSDGSHTLSAVAEDASGNYATSSISITTDNTPPVISAISSSIDSSDTFATTTWMTDEAAASKVVYGPTTAYGSVASNASSHNLALDRPHRTNLWRHLSLRRRLDRQLRQHLDLQRSDIGHAGVAWPRPGDVDCCAGFSWCV